MTFEYEGKSYDVKMTRAGIRAAEAQGLSTDQMTAKPQSSLALLFFAGLFSQYKVNPNKAASMLDDLLDAGTLQWEELFEELADEYNELFGLGESKE